MVAVRIKEMAVDEVLPGQALPECSGTGSTLGLDLLIGRVAWPPPNSTVPKIVP